MIPPSLEAEIREVLGKLAMISEAPASKPPELAPPAVTSKRPDKRKSRRIRPGEWGMRSKSPTRHSTSKPPAGVRPDDNSDPNRPPDKDRSVHDWYAWQFARCGDDLRRVTTYLLLARRELYERTIFTEHRRALRSGELTENDVRDGGVAEREDAKRVIEHYEGMSALEVAIAEYCEEAWVRKVRVQANRNVSDGTPRAEFLQLDEDDRKRVVGALHWRGMNRSTVADRLRVSRPTIDRYWPEENLQDAA